MNDRAINEWLKTVIPKHQTLTKTVVNIVESLLDANAIDYLAVTGRTKTDESIKEKIKRKSYSKPDMQMTDLSGIRIIAYFESDVERISEIIEQSFHVDNANSLSKDNMLATDQIGYRSIHYVCDLGGNRCSLPEFSSLAGLKFEFQIRTVLQHAWAELAHDRNYKFTGKLPREIERKLFLYAGMLEIADKGFDEISKEIDEYIVDYAKRTEGGDFDVDINSLSLDEFVSTWCKKNEFNLEPIYFKSDIGQLVKELEQLGITKISHLMKIVPNKYAEVARDKNYGTNIFGMLRDWMLIYDYRLYHEKVEYDWSGFNPEEQQILDEFLTPEQMSEVYVLFD